MRSTTTLLVSAMLMACWFLAPVLGQGAPPAAAGDRQTAAKPESWWVDKPRGGAYQPPMRPLWRLSDLKKEHAGHDNWSEPIIRDAEQDVTYNSVAPGTRISPRMHPETPTVFVVMAGDVHFTIEGQDSVTATRGSIINILRTTLYSYEVTGSQSALFVEVNVRGYSTVYPVDSPKPQATTGNQVVKVAFNHTPGVYTAPNKLHYNTFDAIARCVAGPAVQDDHLYANPLLGYVNPADNKCGTGSGNIGSGPAKPGAPPFDPNTPFGHLHSGAVEWWIVQVGAISGKFENLGQFHATEGDVLYAAPMTWHDMAAEAPSGPSVRLAMGAYQRINMNNTGP